MHDRRLHFTSPFILILVSLCVLLILITAGLLFAQSIPHSAFEAESGTALTNAAAVSDAQASNSSALSFTAPPTGEVTCSLNATTANFASQVTTATAGQTICLATGNYGTWTGTNKAITITKQAGATPTIAVDFNTGDAGFTIDGLTVNGGSIVNGARDITFKNSAFTSSLVIDNVANANILIDTSTFNNQSTNSTCTQTPARVHLSYGSATPSGVTIQNSVFDGGNKDGIQTGTALTIKNNIFSNIRENSSNDCQHTDPIQGVGASGVVVTGNLLHDNADGVVEFEESTNWIVTDNACYNIDRGACITLYSDRNSLVEHNSARGIDVLELDRKSANRAGSGTIFRNNVGTLTTANGSVVGVNTNNLFTGAVTPNISGSPLFVGGTSPTTWAGFKLNSNSPGVGAATDGLNVGIR